MNAVLPDNSKGGASAAAAASAAPITVMHVITSLNVGGAERMLARLVTGDGAGRVAHRVVSLMPGGLMRPEIEAAGIRVRDLGMTSSLGAAGGMIRLARLIRAERPDVVHSWLYHADLLATLALGLSGRRAATRLIWGIRCSDMDLRQYAHSARAVRRILTRLSPRPDLVLCNAEAGRRAHEQFGYRPRQWRIIPNGLDLDPFRPRDGERAELRAALGLTVDAFAVGICARVDPMKDHENFVRAAALFAKAAPEARFVLIGAGTDTSGTVLDRQIAQSGLGARFIRLGQRADVDRLLPALDLATLSSAFGEGFPNVLVEAMACGVPCVATDIGDSALIIGDTGLTVPPRDAASLAAAWGRIRDEGHEARAARGAAARRRVADRYAIGPVIGEYRDLYKELALTGGSAS